MKKTIVCVKDNNRVGYWSRADWKILTRTIYTYDNEHELLNDFDECSAYIPFSYEGVVPVIMIVSFETPAEMIADSCNRHLANAKRHWPHMPDRIDTIEQAISKIKH
jgi:hypothetical protein